MENRFLWNGLRHLGALGMVARRWSSSRLSYCDRLLLKCNGNAENSSPIKKRKDASSRATRRKRGSSGCAQGIFCNPQAESVYKDWSTINRVWAPQIFWDPDYVWENGEKGGYMIYYSMLNRAEESYDRMYYSYADKSFTRLTQPRLLFDWGYATIDADINLLDDGLYHMLIKKEGGKPGIYTATSKHLTSGWGEPVEDDYVSFEGNKKCEGSSAFQLMGDKTWRVAYIQYSDRPKHYRICKADENLRNFHDPVDIEGVTGPQHGSFMRLTKKEYKRLQKWSAKQKY